MLPDRLEFGAFVESAIWKPVLREESFILPHQRFAAAYLDPSTPYRGLLLYHGLGTGKTCASIAVAQATLNARKKVIVLAPASLRKNFEQEVIKCGGQEFSLNRSWLITDDTIQPVEAGEGRPYSTLTETEQSRVRQWMNDLVRQRYSILGYNGLSKQGFDKLTSDGTRNPFDNALVIIDEVHNLTRTLANAKSNNTVKFSLYNLILDAQRCKIVALSGSPAINQAYEFSFLVNMLRGRLVEYKLQWNRTLVGDEITSVKKLFVGSPKIDTNVVTAAGASLTLPPPGFEFVQKSKGMVKATTGSHMDTVLSLVAKYVSKRGGVSQNRFDALPSEKKQFDAMFIDPLSGDIIRKTMLMRRMRGVMSFYDVRDGALYPNVVDRVLKLPLSSVQYTEYIKARVKERQIEDNVAKQGENGTSQNVHKAYSRPILNFVFPVGDGIRKWRRDEIRAEMQEEGGHENSVAEDAEYDRRTERALRKLLASDVWTNDAKLATHSPKFHAIYHSIEQCVGKSMVYSAFRALEGAGLMMALLNARGWEYVTLVKSGKGGFKLNIEGGGQEGAPRYICPIPSSEEGGELLKIYNGEIDKLKEPLRSEVKKRLGGSNLRGEMIKTVLLTKSGAEGLTLKCVRQVHIMEPHWNNAHMEQVKGRSIRLRSHMELPEEERSVETVTYVATFSEQQRADPDFKRTEDRDGGLTSDEDLLRRAGGKDDQISQLMELVRRTSVDCTAHIASHRAAGLTYSCYEPPSSFQDIAMMPANIEMDREDSTARTKAKVIQISDPNGVLMKLVIIDDKAYDADKWAKGSKQHIANIVGKQLVWT
jgi:hypothetical protein